MVTFRHKNGKNYHLVEKNPVIMRQLLTGIEKIIRGLRTLNKAFLSGTNPSSVTQVVLEMQAKQVEF